MNELLQKHGCSNVFTVPEGLRELMSDITREVLRTQPPRLLDFISNYLSVLIITREHGVMAVKILDDLCDCRPSVTEHLEAAGITPMSHAADIASIIQEEIEQMEPEEGSEKVQETQILKKILRRYPIDEVMTAKVCQIARNAYRDYWYRKRLLEQSLKKTPEEPWEMAAAHTLEIYKRTNPSFNELNRATEKIQAAYKGYHVRRNLLFHKKKKPQKSGPKRNLPGPPLDVAESREIDLGRVININVPQDDVNQMFEEDVRNKLEIPYDPTHMLTLVPDDDKNDCACDPIQQGTSKHTTPRTPFSSMSSHLTEPGLPGQESSSKSGRFHSRISFAPTTPLVIGDHDGPKVEEAHALVPAHDTDATDDEIEEDITEHTHTEGDGTGTVSGTMPETTDATDEDLERE